MDKIGKQYSPVFIAPRQVVNNTISKDLEDINKKVKESSKLLRTERIRLIKIKAKEVKMSFINFLIYSPQVDIECQQIKFF